MKEYLLAHPRDAAAHYVLGKCYLHRQDVNTTLAKGEFETALFCFDGNPDLGVLAPEMTPDQFRSAVHRDIALALMRAIYEGDGQGLPPSVMFPALDQALEHVRNRPAPRSQLLLPARNGASRSPNCAGAGRHRTDARTDARAAAARGRNNDLASSVVLSVD